MPCFYPERRSEQCHRVGLFPQWHVVRGLDQPIRMQKKTINFSFRRYDYHTGQRLLDSKGERHNLVTAMAHVNMLIINGTVFVTQVPGSTAEDTRRNSYTVTTAAPFTVAQGNLYVDDGIHPDESAHDLINFTFDETSFKMELMTNKLPATVLDISRIVNTVRILGLDLKRDQVPDNANYDNVTMVLEFNNLDYDWTKNNYYSFNYIKK